jgi:hypothetical protein
MERMRSDMKMFMYPYKTGSESAKELRHGMGMKMIRPENSRFKGGKDKMVLNWGCSEIANPEVHLSHIINHPHNVRNVSNKLTFFSEIHDPSIIPPFTTDIAAAQAWADRGDNVVCRHKLTGHSGDGIEICEEGDVVPAAPLYVLYMKKKWEFRCHAFDTGNCFIQQKARRMDVPDEDVNWKVRNHENGFIYKIPNCGDELCDRMSVLGLAVVRHFRLQFGAVDIIYNESSDKLWVLEVNSAPGLVGRTVEFYINELNKLKELAKNE